MIEYISFMITMGLFAYKVWVFGCERGMVSTAAWKYVVAVVTLSSVGYLIFWAFNSVFTWVFV